MYKIVRMQLDLETNSLSETVVKVYECLLTARKEALKLNLSQTDKNLEKAVGYQVRTS